MFQSLPMSNAIWNVPGADSITGSAPFSVMRSALGSAFVFGRSRLSTNLPAGPPMNSLLLKFIFFAVYPAVSKLQGLSVLLCRSTPGCLYTSPYGQGAIVSVPAFVLYCCWFCLLERYALFVVVAELSAGAVFLAASVFAWTGFDVMSGWQCCLVCFCALFIFEVFH